MKLFAPGVPLIWGPENTTHLPGCAPIAMPGEEADRLASLNIGTVVEASPAAAPVETPPATEAEPHGG